MTVAPTILPHARTVTRIAAIPAAIWLTGLIALSFVLRVVASLGHVAPRLFPDEYIYATLGRSLGHGSLTIRGESAGFPALLEPLAAAPLWLVAGDDLELGYRLVQGMHALVVSLPAIPVYLLARRLALSNRMALACAALTLALPALALAPFVMADAFALPFAIGAVAAGTAALDRPGWKPQMLFLTLAGLATLARVQYVVLPLALLAAGLLVSRWNVRRAARDLRPTLIALSAVAMAAVLAGPGRALGYYEGITGLTIDVSGIGRWLASDALLLAYAAGWVIVPLALVGLVLGIARPRTRPEHAFAALVGVFSVLVLLEAAIYAANGAERFQERYLIALLPLVPLLAVLGARRLEDRAGRIAVATVSGLLLLAAALVPLTGFAALTGKQDSPTLWAVAELTDHIGDGSAALVLALAAGGLAVLAGAAAVKPRAAAPVTLALSGAVLVALGFAAVRYDVTQSERTKLSFGDPEQSWVDDAGVGDVAVLQTPYSSRVQISSQLFWNSSLVEILQMKDSSGVDAYGSTAVETDAKGRIVADGEVVTRPLLVEEYAAWAELEEARLVRRTVNAALWVPRGTPRLSLLLAGRYFDGMLSAGSSITVWPGREGRRVATLELPLSLPDGVPATEISVTGPGVDRVVTVPSGGSIVLRLSIDTTVPWQAELLAVRPLNASGGRLIAALAGVPRLTDTPQTGEKGVKD